MACSAGHHGQTELGVPMSEVDAEASRLAQGTSELDTSSKAEQEASREREECKEQLQEA